MNIKFIIAVVLLLWNLAAFIIMGIDKSRARRGAWRVPEKTLFFMAFVFGGIGILAGMLVFRHKTKHMSFKILVPLGIILDIVIICLAAALLNHS